jgi:hypothetical protein
MSQQRDEVYKVNSYFINYFLTSLNRRSHRNEKPFIKDYLVTLFYYLGVIHYFLMLLIEFDYETRLILFDLSIFIGGIAKYNLVMSLLAAILGARLHESLYLTPLANSDWIKLIKFTGSKALPQGINRRDVLVYEKYLNRSKFIYKLLDLTIISFGKN